MRARALRRPLDRLDRVLGGPERRTIIVTLALVLALDTADSAAVGAAATQLHHAFGIDNTMLGLLTTISGVVGALATLPFGVLVDRTNRVRLLQIVVGVWSVAMALTAAATSFTFLLIARSMLGILVAAAVPAVASLVGDWFRPSERGAIYGYILTGELIGAGIGFTVSGSLAAISWRAAFLVLAPPALFVAWLVHRLSEPERSGATPSDDALSPAQRRVLRSDVAPDPSLVLDSDPTGWSFWRAARYALRIPTNVTLIVAGVLAYFFFAGVRAFGVEFVKHQYGIGQGTASSLTLILGVFAVAGVVVGGWVSDRLLNRGRLTGRILVGAVALLGAAALFVPALLVRSFGIAILTLGGAAAALAAVNPPLDAARLDIMPAALWGRAESVRTLVRQPLQATAPLVFGLLSDSGFGGGHTGLRDTFLVMLAPLVVAGVYAVLCRNRYPRDLATAAASKQHLAAAAGHMVSSSCT